jgi:sortase A
MLIGFALLVVGGVSAYPAIRSILGLDVAPPSFGDEQTLSGSIVEPNESLPQVSSDSASAPDPGSIVLPETPLQSEVSPAPEPTSTLALTPTATPAGAPSPTATPVATAQPGGEFKPAPPTRLVIPAIQVDAPVETVGWSVVEQDGQQLSMWDVPNRRAAGWLRSTALLGEPGNTVLDGHHNIFGEVFRDLVDLEQGDAIQVWAGDQMREYVVSLRKILPEKGQPLEVRLENAKWIQPTKDERLTLISCWPYTNNTHRLVVVAVLSAALPTPSTDRTE